MPTINHLDVKCFPNFQSSWYWLLQVFSLYNPMLQLIMTIYWHNWLTVYWLIDTTKKQEVYIITQAVEMFENNCSKLGYVFVLNALLCLYHISYSLLLSLQCAILINNIIQALSPKIFVYTTLWKFLHFVFIATTFFYDISCLYMLCSTWWGENQCLLLVRFFFLYLHANNSH